ncbi:MAG TPA: glycosyltransferase [Patescibacteria group bacterium]|nr:glycosyltransferase [Patescibacteria group bacterium]
MSKVLILSLKAGTGHRIAGEALEEYGQAHFPDWEVKHVDATPYLSPISFFFHIRSYNFLSANGKWLWKLAYNFWDRKFPAKFLRQLAKIQSRLNPRLVKLLKQENPDAVIFTILGCAQILLPVIEKEFPNLKTFALITDYSVHNINIVPGVKYYFVPTPEAKEKIINNPVPHEEVTITGIPVRQLFLTQTKTPGLYERYHFLPAWPTVVFLTGGNGVVKAKTYLKELLDYPHPLNLFVNTGNNPILFKNLRTLKFPSWINFHLSKWTDDLPSLFSIANLVITKPGGLTVTEALHQGAPLLLIDPIPGQETNNLDYLEKNHYAVALKDHKKIKELVADIINKKIQLAVFPQIDNPAEKIFKVIEQKLAPK